MSKKNSKIDFGFKNVNVNEKESLVKEIFDHVSSNYNLMNDLTSIGLHRFWKDQLINWLAPQPHQTLRPLCNAPVSPGAA